MKALRPAVDQEHRARDARGERAIRRGVERHRRRGAVKRIEAPCDAPVGLLLQEVRGARLEDVRRDLRVLGGEPSHGVLAGRERPRAPPTRQVVQPLRRAIGGVARIVVRRSHTFQQREPVHVLRPRAGVEAADGPAHRVPDDGQPRRGELLHQRVQIRDVVEEVVVAPATDPLALAEAAEVHREHVMPGPREVRRDAVPRARRVREPVDEHHRRVRRRDGGGRRPGHQVEVEPAERKLPARAHRGGL